MTDAMQEQRPDDMKPIRVHRASARDALADIQQHRQYQHRAADGMVMMERMQKHA